MFYESENILKAVQRKVNSVKAAGETILEEGRSQWMQAKRIEKIIQNIKIARRARTKLALLNIKDKRDALSFIISLGASSQQVKEAISF